MGARAAASSLTFLSTLVKHRRIMDFIVDIQGFRDTERKFLPKEVAVICLQNPIVNHWIVQAPCNFIELPEDVKNTNSYCAVDIHGINWFEGEVSLRQVHRYLFNIARAARRIYVRGEEKTRYLESLLGRNIFNLEKYDSPTFRKLNSMFSDVLLCSTHSSKRFKNKQDFCALYKAHQIKKWMRSILPEWKMLQKKQVQSEMFFTALHQYQQEERKRLLRFHPGSEKSDDVEKQNNDGHDELDVGQEITSDTDSSIYFTFSENAYNENKTNHEGH